jgi:hypothetical protein
MNTKQTVKSGGVMTFKQRAAHGSIRVIAKEMPT